MSETFTCPVCGNNQLSEPPTDHSICPCCGTHFAYDDATLEHSVLTARWIESGAKWRSKRYETEPIGWSAVEQLRNIGYEVGSK